MIKKMRILQTNLERSRRAYDVFFQSILEGTIALAAVAEPYRALHDPNWAVDTDGCHLDVSAGGVRPRGSAGVRQRIRSGRITRNGDGERECVAQKRMDSVRGVFGRGRRLPLRLQHIVFCYITLQYNVSY